MLLLKSGTKETKTLNLIILSYWGGGVECVSYIGGGWVEVSYTVTTRPNEKQQNLVNIFLLTTVYKDVLFYNNTGVSPTLLRQGNVNGSLLFHVLAREQCLPCIPCTTHYIKHRQLSTSTL